MRFAYLDPGSGSLLLQAVLGGLAGLGVAAKAWRNKLRNGGNKTRDQGAAVVETPVEDKPQTAES